MRTIVVAVFAVLFSLLCGAANANSLRLYVAKITYSDGPLDFPCVLLAGTIEEASKLIVESVPDQRIVGLLLSEWPLERAQFMGLNVEKPDRNVLLVRQMTWSSVLALRPTWPLDTSGSGNALVAGSAGKANPDINIAPNWDFLGYVMMDGPHPRPGESGQETHERLTGEDLKSLPNGGRGSAHGGGP